MYCSEFPMSFHPETQGHRTTWESLSWPMMERVVRWASYIIRISFYLYKHPLSHQNIFIIIFYWKRYRTYKGNKAKKKEKKKKKSESISWNPCHACQGWLMIVMLSANYSWSWWGKVQEINNDNKVKNKCYPCLLPTCLFQLQISSQPTNLTGETLPATSTSQAIRTRRQTIRYGYNRIKQPLNKWI